MKAAAIAALLLAGLSTAAIAQVKPATPRPAGALDTAIASLAMVSSHDGAGFAALLLPGAVVLSQRHDAEGRLVSRIMSAAEIAAFINDKARTLNESMLDPVVMIEGDIAHVWAPYTFDMDGKRTHCGVDSIALAKVDGTWRIASFTWTVEPAGCAKWNK